MSNQELAKYLGVPYYQTLRTWEEHLRGYFTFRQYLWYLVKTRRA